MKIGIDCRLWGVKHAGIGRYTQNLVKNLAEIDKDNKYVLFCHSEDMGNMPRFQKSNVVVADIKHYSLREQLALPKLYFKENLNLLHMPHFNVPLFYKGKFVVTIHDVLWHQIKGLSVTTLSPLAYGIKYAGYRMVVRHAVKNAQRVITPTNFVKEDLVKRFSLQPDKVVVTSEGVTLVHSSKHIVHSKKVLGRYKIKTPYIFYVGSLYPHKNLEIAVMAVKQLSGKAYLVIAGSRNVFTDNFKSFVKSEKAEDLVSLTGYVPDEDLGVLYSNATAFVFPTLSEGFGLPGLEAMSAGCPVICSDIPVLHEVYGDAAHYFNPQDQTRITELIQELLSNQKLRADMVKKGKERIKLYSWQKMAQQTLSVYESVLI